MSVSRSYTAELEYIIRDILLPVYDRYYREKGIIPPYTAIPSDILKTLYAGRKTPALFLPKKDARSNQA